MRSLPPVLPALTLLGAVLTRAVAAPAADAPALPSRQAAIPAAPADIDWGPNVLVLDPAMDRDELQRRVDAVFRLQEKNHFGPERRAILLQPGTYDAEIRVGFYTQVLGLGRSPDDVVVRGAVSVDAQWAKGTALVNFWRSAENLCIEPKGGTAQWAVSQASPLRRVHVRGDLRLDDGGYSSGGFLADALVDGTIHSGTQQQWLTRNSRIGGWHGSSWNYVFSGVEGAPAGDFLHQGYVVLPTAPNVAEKPFLARRADGGYEVLVPPARRGTSGCAWREEEARSRRIPLEQFHVAHEGRDNAASLNAALAAGRHLLLTPGVYRLERALDIQRPDTIVLGLGLATLQSEDGSPLVRVADVDGVRVAGLLLDAGPVDAPVLMEVGPAGSSADHAANPTALHDVYFRIGGGAVGRAAVSLRIHSCDVIGDNLWLWRADHTQGVGWEVNTTGHGLVVEGAGVTIHGLAVEHYHREQVVWNGERGRVVFYQSEEPYDVPSEAAWGAGDRVGFPSYAVGETVREHEAWGLGVYCFFNTNKAVRLSRAIAAPERPGVRLHGIITVSLGGVGEITHLVNDTGPAANSSAWTQRLAEWP